MLYQEPIQNVVVSLSNLSYFLVALWLYKTHHPYAWMLVIVGIVSSVFHVMPEKEVAYWTDIVVANATILWFLAIYGFGHHHTNYQMVTASVGIFLLGIVLFTYSCQANDCDRETTKYMVLHSLWHVLTAAALFLLVKSTDPKKLSKGLPRSTHANTILDSPATHQHSPKSI